MVKQHPCYPARVSCKGAAFFPVLDVLRETLQTDSLLCSTTHTFAAMLYQNAAHFACHDSTVTEDIIIAEDNYTASPKHSPRRSPREMVQTPCQQEPLTFEPQAGPSSPVPGALPQQALSPLQPQPSPPDVTQAPGQSASPAHPDTHESSCPNNTANSGMKHQHRADSSQPAQSHQRGHPALSVRTAAQSPAGPPNQELLAGLGSALRAQARLRRKAVAPETASPDERDSSVTGNLGDVSPSGQLSFDAIELKSNGKSRPYN